MVQHRLAASIRGTALVLAAGSAAIAACHLAAPFVTAAARPLLADGLRGLDALAFEDALAGLSAALLLGCVLWLSLTGAVTVAAYVAQEVAAGTRVARLLTRAVERGCPAVVHRLVAGTLGVAVTVGLAGPALADPLPVRPTSSGATSTGTTSTGATSTGPERLRGLALPDRAVGAAWTVQVLRSVAPEAAAGPATRPRTRDSPRPVARDVVARDVVVRPGQSLWTIAAGLLPAPATDAEVTRAWQRLHHANASVIGADPDLILPGTRLVVPHLDAPSLREDAP